MYRAVAALAASLIVVTAAHAQTYEARLKKVLSSDAPRAADHALVGRYAGSFLLAQSVKEFDELILPAGPHEGSYSTAKWDKVEKVEGKVTRSIYVVPSERSTLEVQRNFQDALTQKGFAPVWECAREACGENFPALKFADTKPETLVVSTGYDNERVVLGKAVFDYVKDVRYTLMKKNAPEGVTLVGIYTVIMTGGSNGNLSDLLKGTTQTLLEIVEPKTMQRNLVTIASAEIASKVMSEGRIAFYGINFDFDKADIKPESAPQLAEMAKFLQENPQARVYIVGHTDNKGGLDYNLSLSGRRADAVAKTLAGKYGIDAKRMVARGLGSLAPVASNRSEDGQAKNRRVEMVEQ